MVSKTWAGFNSALRHFHKDDFKPYLKFLPPKIQESLVEAKLPDNLTETLFPNIEELIKGTHFSWLISAFKDLSEETYQLFFSVLSLEQQMGLSEVAKRPMIPLTLSQYGKSFIATYLYKHFIQTHKILPLPFLEKTDLDALFTFDHRSLVHFIDFLGLYQLSIELRDISDQKLISRASEVLSPERRLFLETCSEDAENFTLSPINIAAWDGNRRNLEIILHQKGLQRFALVLLSLNENMVEHLCHKFDTGRAQAIKARMDEELDNRLAPSAFNQCLKSIEACKQIKNHAK